MTKNKKKALRLLQSGTEISEKRFPVNYLKAIDANAKNSNGKRALGVPEELEPMTEAEFHQAHSVEKEQV